MCKIRPFVNLKASTLTVSAPGMPDLVLPLSWGKSDARSSPPAAPSNSAEAPAAAGSSSDPAGIRRLHRGGTDDGWGRQDVGDGGDVPLTVRVCGNRRAGVTCASSASAWFTRFLGVPCWLVRAAAATSVAADWSGPSAGFSIKDDDDNSTVNKANAVGVLPFSNIRAAGRRVLSAATAPAAVEENADRAFANEAQYLLISRASVAKVNQMGLLDREDSGDGDRGSAPAKVCIPRDDNKLMDCVGRAGGRAGGAGSSFQRLAGQMCCPV